MRVRPLAVALALAFAPTAMHAQQQVGMSAVVPTASPTGAGVRNLSFGAVAPALGQTTIVTVPAQVAPISATVFSGEFRLNVQGSSGLQFVLGLPPTLAAGGVTMPISFSGASYGARCIQSSNGTCTPVSFDPAGGPVLVCRSGNSGHCAAATWPAGTLLRVFVGGQLSVAASQPAGLYSGTVTLTIAQVF